ncbi:Wall-associated receptor kinase 1 [Hibiscus syriacus]|uniref:Wall-associated receptor kinase 1 n=1 Tax=Hibiscus syriacus TaxID=106335 RepID=A0A6A2YYV2_HIBSY|nr:Wall-associated receptor kinase 1 [Hibiscus syriacus]
MSIPFPFGTGSTDCNISRNFFIRCNTTFNPPKAFLTTSEIEVVHSSLDGYLRINESISYDCYNSAGHSSYFDIWMDLVKFSISHTRNKLTAIGCDTCAYVRDYEGDTYSTGCLTFCNNITDVINGSCSGIGCCQTAIPKGVKSYHVTLASSNNHSKILDFNPCSYGFVMEDGAYNFSVSDLYSDDFRHKEFPMILDWTIGTQTCAEAKMDAQNYACKQNPGYLCKCLDGFKGNPYLSNGCQVQHVIIQLEAIAVHAPKGSRVMVGKTEQVAVFKPSRAVRVFPSLLFHLGETAKIFTVEQLKKATNNYHESRILGQGGQGTVYKGTLPDGRNVAIKKSIIGNQSQVQHFINEVIVLSQINHRNVVKLLGCCLETRVPLLVYEYVRNGTLFHHLHNASVMPWEARLKTAIEATEAISYLHSSASPPIIHRDVKLTNILLDENYNAKVSDFGASRLVPSNKEQITTLVKGTLGYLDPEYFQTSQLTEKSDVYSFGVVLIELLTGLVEILDGRMVNDDKIEQLEEAATIARRCERLKGEERPSMKEVVSELQGLLAMEKHSWGKRNLHEEERLNTCLMRMTVSLTQLPSLWSLIA